MAAVAETSHATHLESTIEMIEKDVEKKSVTGASGAITEWITTLSHYDELKPISSKLEKLKEAISEKDGKKIVELMTSLGEATTKAAEEAEADDSKKIKMLGKCLVTAAKVISKFA